MTTTTKTRARRRRGGRSPVVAEVLADGSIRLTESGRRADRDDQFALGQVSGDGWILWWQRRRLEGDRRGESAREA